VQPKVTFLDDIFEDLTLDWISGQPRPEHVQRHLAGNGSIICETILTIPGSTEIDDAVPLILGPWVWWLHGRARNFSVNEDGSSDQVLLPVWWFITRVTLHILPPVPLPDTDGVRISIILGRYFVGLSTIDVYPDHKRQSLIIRGRFHGVEYTVPCLPTAFGGYLHLGAETGTMPFPFPKNTGWVELERKVLARCTARLAAGLGPAASVASTV
jgi:hypothetical protein